MPTITSLLVSDIPIHNHVLNFFVLSTLILGAFCALDELYLA